MVDQSKLRDQMTMGLAERFKANTDEDGLNSERAPR